MSGEHGGSKNGANGTSNGGGGPDGEDLRGRTPRKIPSPIIDYDSSGDDDSTEDEDAILAPALLPLIPPANPVIPQEDLPEVPNFNVPQLEIPVNQMYNQAIGQAVIVPGMPLGGNEMLLNWGPAAGVAVQEVDAAAAGVAVQEVDAAAAAVAVQEVDAAAAAVAVQEVDAAAAADEGGQAGVVQIRATQGGSKSL